MLKEAAPGPDQRTEGNPRNANGPSLLYGGGCSLRLTLDDILEILGWTDEEHAAVCHKPIGGSFCTAVEKSVNASALVTALRQDADVWFSVNPTAGPPRQRAGRGNEQQVIRWAALHLDVDVKDGAFSDLEKAVGFLEALSGMVGTRPSVLIHSGHGLQPLWPIEDGELNTDGQRGRAYRLSRRFGQLARRVAGEHFACLDTVSDLARILRVPKTTNWKEPANPAPVYAVLGTGGPLTVDLIEEFLDEWAPDLTFDEPVMGEVVSPAESWNFASSTCPYVAAMVRSWCRRSDEPSAGRHQWAMSRCVRLAAAHRCGCITRGGLDEALGVLESALRHWCQVVGSHRDLAPAEVHTAYKWAAAKVATLDEHRARSELGHHQHCSARARRWTLVGI